MKKEELIKRYEEVIDYGYLEDKVRNVYIEIVKSLDQLDEPQNPVIPQFVADWIEECKDDDFHLFGAMEGISSNQKKLDYWFREDDNMELFARAWLDGYEVEKEKRYLVKVKGMVEDFLVLKLDKIRDGWYLGNDTEYSYTKAKHTRKELEEAGFGWVFDCPGVKIEEVEE